MILGVTVNTIRILTSENDVATSKVILTAINIPIVALGMMGVLRRNYIVFTGFIAWNMMQFMHWIFIDCILWAITAESRMDANYLELDDIIKEFFLEMDMHKQFTATVFLVVFYLLVGLIVFFLSPRDELV